MAPDPEPPPFDPPAALVNRLRAAYINCSETTFYNVSARFSGVPTGRFPRSIVALATQTINKEERLLAITAGMIRLDNAHVWPLGGKPTQLYISPTGLYVAMVRDPPLPKDVEAFRKEAAGASSLQTALRRTHVTTRLQIELFGTGQGGGIGNLLCLSAPGGCKSPWGEEHGGGSFCLGNENLFVFAVEPATKSAADNKNRLIFGEGKASATDIDSYVYEVDWGEQQAGHRLSRLCCVDFKRRSTELLPPPDETYAYGQARWLPDATGLVCTGWSTTPYCLGLEYCWVRRSKVFLALLPKRWNATVTPPPPPTPTAANRKAADDEHAEDLSESLFSSFREDGLADETTQWLQLSANEDFAAWSPVVLEVMPYKDNNASSVQVAYLAMEKGVGEVRPHACAVFVKVVVLKRSPTDPSKWYIESRRALQQPVESSADISKSTRVGNKDDFAGVYASCLVAWRHPRYLFVNTFIRNRAAIVCLHTEGAKRPETVEIGKEAFSRLFPGATLADCGKYYSMKLLDTRDDWLLIEFSSLVHTPRLLVAEFVEAGAKSSSSADESSAGGAAYSSSYLFADFLGGLLLGGVPEDQKALQWTPYYALVRHLRKLVVSSDEHERHLVVGWPYTTRPLAKNSLAVCLHGGPHAVACSSFRTDVAFLTMIGYDVLFVNYTGSLGFGQKDVFSLLGKIGKQDVADVAEAVTEYLEHHPTGYDRAKTVVLGGSHGGFLTCHLLGQYPNLFAAAAVRNPVTNLLGMVSASDIPDWVYAEALNADFDPALLLTPEEISRCHQASPLVHARHIITPLLLGIGGKDQRVPPATQGIAFYKTLTALGRRTRLLFYPEADHRIHQPYYQEDFWLNAAAWFVLYAGEPGKP